MYASYLDALMHIHRSPTGQDSGQPSQCIQSTGYQVGVLYQLSYLSGISNLCLRSLFKPKLWCVRLNSKPPIHVELTSKWQIQLLYRFPRWCSGKESPANPGDCNRCGFDPWVGKISWSRKWQPTLVLLPGKFHGQWWTP